MEEEVKADVKANTLLSTFIRENLNLTGTHIGCDTSQCGACAIHLNGDAVKSCAILAVHKQMEQKLQRLKELLMVTSCIQCNKHFTIIMDLQCGYCTPGYGYEFNKVS